MRFFAYMRLPPEVWKLEDPYKRLAWAILLLARYDAREGGDHRTGALRYLAGEEAGALLDLLGVDRNRILSNGCHIEEV